MIRIALTAVLVFAAGCASRGEAVPGPDPYPVDGTVTHSASGAIYQPYRDVALFENPVATRVGDIVIVRLAENTNAVKKASTSTQKSTSVSLPGPTIAGRPVTVNGTDVLTMGVENDNKFDGAGSSEQSNRLNGNITATVVQRLPNGNLVIRGQKWLTLNQGSEFVRIEGVVRPIDIEPDNSIASWKVADARNGYGGKGALADANRQSWFARFFNSPLMPF
ncbi:MAG: flagellar basal body L-ring protein FlgH [Steroidobacteraceae bacterium]|nr:flagellar basal body L-ring protein FlgH [Steroidobacteraceae bacterium]